MNVIEVEGLRKEIRRRRGGKVSAVAGLDLIVPAGGVFGFLGPNGSGKTTTIRCLLGLARPTGGSCRLLGAAVPGGLRQVTGRVGALVETPGLNPGMTARQIMLVHARIAGMSRRRADDVIAQVGLAGRDAEAVKGFSLGMRQRLGVALALLKDPEVLILDEPANGLDPAGIREMRQLVRRLGDEGRTVFLSSHQLAEVQQICDRVAILARGRAVAEGTVADVLATEQSGTMLVRVPDHASALSALSAVGIEAVADGDALRVTVPPGGLRGPYGLEGPATITAVLGASDIWLSELRPDEASLEDVFLRLTGDDAVNHLDGLRGPNAVEGLRGPNAVDGPRGPNAMEGER
ncbi:MAG: ABC transporter ATP-binding protein [Acidimicrobiales bacterium]